MARGGDRLASGIVDDRKPPKLSGGKDRLSSDQVDDSKCLGLAQDLTVDMPKLAPAFGFTNDGHRNKFGAYGNRGVLWTVATYTA